MKNKRKDEEVHINETVDKNDNNKDGSASDDDHYDDGDDDDVDGYDDYKITTEARTTTTV